MRCVPFVVLLVLLGAACAADSTARLAAPFVGDYPESLAFVDTDASGSEAQASTGEAPAPLDDSGTEPAGEPVVLGAEDGGVTVDLSNEVDRLAACAAVVGLGSGTITEPTDIAAAFDDILPVFNSFVLMTIEAAMLGENEAAMTLALDPDVALQHLRLDAQTNVACGVPLYAATLGTATPDVAPGNCFMGTALEASDKIAMGALLNEDLFSYERVPCSD